MGFRGTHVGQNPGYLSNVAIQRSTASLVAFVLNAIEFHAHGGTIWSAELQLRRLPDGVHYERRAKGVAPIGNSVSVT